MSAKTVKKSTAKRPSPKTPRKRTPSKKGSTIKMSHIRGKALELELKVPVGISKTELIRSIQRAEGSFDCFGTAYEYCDQFGCYWRSLCIVKQS